MPRPRPPSRVDVVTVPLFGICWYGNPGTGHSILAYCGGGGSAATGIGNFITIRDIAGLAKKDIPTGDEVGVALTICQNPITQVLHLLVAIKTKVIRYNMDTGAVTGELEVGVNLNCLAANAMCDQLVVGCETGAVHVYAMSDERLGGGGVLDNDDNAVVPAEEEENANPAPRPAALPIHVYEGHEKAVCAVSFSLREGFVVSSAKDGTARVWKNGNAISTLTCSIEDPKAKGPKRAQQIMVRGCSFGDLQGQLIYTIASGRRGRAFLSKWSLDSKKQDYDCIERTACSDYPISAVSLSGDAGLMVLGAVDGTIILWGIERWRPLKTFREVHDLPVTCIAARPYPVPLRGEEESGVQFHAISASADSQLAFCTLQKHVPTNKYRDEPSGISLRRSINSLVRMALLLWMLSPVAHEIWDKCEDQWDNSGYVKTWECIRYDVLLAPPTRPGILVPPH
jgi:WD40 repeat protein